MKKFLTLFFLLPTLLLAQRPDVLVKTEIFIVHYSEVYQQPLSISYQVQCPGGQASRKGMDFYTNDSILTSDNADYENNIYDKGHLAPAAAFSCTKEMLFKTFSYLNCALQDQYLNRGAWRLLEAQERKMAETSAVKVEIVLEFKNSIKLPTGATVPSGFYKKITAGNSVTMYYFPNTKPASSDFSQFRIQNWPKF